MVPTRRRLLVRLNAVIQVWTLFIVVFNTGLDVDIRGDGTLEADDVRTLVITLVVAIVWTAASIALWRWSRKASTPVRLRRARRALTARANEFRAEAWWRDSFPAIVTAHSAGVREYPRFVGEGIEFGTVRLRMPRTRPRSYVCVSLASPLPHLVLDAVENDGVRSGLPENLAERQRISLEGDFDRIFRAYAPRGYARDALYVLTPDVMAVLADHARAFDVEIVEDRAVFFRAERRRWDDPALWREVDAILTHVAPRLRQRSLRYTDERVAGQVAVEIAESLASGSGGHRVAPGRSHGGPGRATAPLVDAPPRVVGERARGLVVHGRNGGLRHPGVSRRRHASGHVRRRAEPGGSLHRPTRSRRRQAPLRRATHPASRACESGAIETTMRIVPSTACSACSNTPPMSRP